MSYQPLLRLLLGAALYDAIQPYRVTEDELMPWAYQRANPQGRPLHDDWALLKGVTRMECAYRVPLPYKVIEGEYTREWLLFDPAYPKAPGTPGKIVDGLYYVLTDRGGYGLVKYAAFINGDWRHVFTKYTRRTWFGKRLSWYTGLHQDNHVSLPDAAGILRSDLMCWLEPFAMSWVKEI